jgi:hypothetical protein
MSRRNWIKIYPEGFLRRTLYKEIPKPAERWAWIGLLCLAGDNAFDGKVCITETMGYTDEQIAAQLCMEVDTFKSAKKKMIKFEKIAVDKNNIIQILGWKTYQSEYSRQRDYQAERRKKLTTQTYNANLRIDKDIDIDIDKDIYKDKDNNTYSPDLKDKSGQKPKINFNFSTSIWENITDNNKKIWIEAYPACDIEQELKKMKAWIISAGAKGHKKDWLRFINSWLSRAQDRSGNVNKKTSDWRRT